MKIEAPVVKGKIVFTATVPAFDDATIHIYLEDVSIADAEALVLTEKIIKGVRHPGIDQQNTTTIPFEIHLKSGEEIDPRNFYGIRAWVDVNSNDSNDSGDLNSDQSFRVLTYGFGNAVEITF